MRSWQGWVEPLEECHCVRENELRPVSSRTVGFRVEIATIRVGERDGRVPCGIDDDKEGVAL